MQNRVPDDLTLKLLLALEQSRIKVELLGQAVLGLAAGADPRARELAAQMVENCLADTRPYLLDDQAVTKTLNDHAERLAGAIAKVLRHPSPILPPPIVE